MTLKSQFSVKKKVDAVNDDSESNSLDSENAFSLDPLQVDSLADRASWYSTISTDKGDVTFKLDSGAEASVIPAKVCHKMKTKPVLKIKMSSWLLMVAHQLLRLVPISFCALEKVSSVILSFTLFLLMLI